MKKIASASLIFFMLLSGCSTNVSNKQIENLSFAPDFTWNKEFAKEYVNQENMAQVSYSGPFYFGSFEGADSFTKAYTKARSKKVDAMLAVVDENVENLNQLHEILKKYRNVLDWYVLNTSNFMPEVREDLYALLDDSERYAILNVAKINYLNTLTKNLSTMPKDSEWGFLAYTKYYLTFDLTDNFEKELASLNQKFVVVYGMSKAKGFDELKTLNAKLDETLQPISEQADTLIRKVAYNGALLAHEEKVLTTADVAYAKEVAANFDQEIPKLKAAIAAYKFTKPSVDQVSIDVMKDQLAVYEEFSTNLKTYLAKIPANQLAEKIEFTLPGAPAQQSMVPEAKAGFYDAMSWVGGTITSAAGTAIDVGIDVAKAGGSMAWSATKTAAGAAVDATVAISDATGVTPYVVTAKNGTIKTVKFAGKVIGTGLDATSAIVKTPYDVVNGVYYGNSYNDIKQTITGNFTAIKDNIDNGVQGHQVYEDTVTILGKSEEVFADGMQGMTKLVMGGEGITSKTVGFASKIVGGFFTGLGKDMVTALNPNTSEKDTLISLFGIGLSCIGGSGSALKGSQALRLGVPKAFQGVKNLTTFLSNIDRAAIKEGITDLFEGGLKGALTNVFSKEGASMALNGIKNVTTLARENLGTALSEGYTLLKVNLMENVPQAFKGMFDKKALTEVFKDVLGVSQKENWRQATIGLLDNIVGSMADDQVKSWVDNGLQHINISEKTITEGLEERKKFLDALKQTIMSQLPELQYLFSIVAPGKYVANVTFSNTQYGITTKANGPLTLTVGNDMAIACQLTMKMSTSGGMRGISVGGSGNANTASCSGKVNPNGTDFKISGSISGMSSVTVSGYGASQKASGGNTVPFVGSGNIDNSSVSGSLTAGGYTFYFNPG